MARRAANATEGLGWPQMAEALAAHLCHDLAGLAGTVSNLLEFAHGDEAAEAIPLAQDAARQLVRRLRLARAAWGGPDQWPPGGLAASVGDLATPELSIVLDAGTRRIGGEAIAGALLLNVAVLGAAVLRRGAIRFVAAGPQDDVAATLSAAAPGTSPDWPALDPGRGEGDRHRPLLFQASWIAAAAQAAGIVLRPEGATLHIRPGPV